MRIDLPQLPPCTGCGNCCRHIGLPPFEVANPDLGPQPVVRTDNWRAGWQLADMATFDRMPAELRASHAALLRNLTADPTGTPCAWLDEATGLCRHYEHRPEACREFAVGTVECIAIHFRGVPCVWIGSAPPAVWKNPRCERRYLSFTHPCD